MSVACFCECCACCARRNVAVNARSTAGAQIRISHPIETKTYKTCCTLLDLCVSSLRKGHANLLCIVPILTDDPRRESKSNGRPKSIVTAPSTSNRPWLASPLAVSMRSMGMTSLPDMVRFSCFENLLCQVELFIRASACAHDYAWLSLCCCVGQHTNTARTHAAQHNTTQHKALE